MIFAALKPVSSGFEFRREKCMVTKKGQRIKSMESAVRTLLGLIFYNSTEPLFVASCCEYIGSSSAALSRHSFQSSVLRRSVESGYVESAIVDRVIYYMYVAVSRGLRLLPRHRESVALTSPVHSLLHA